MIDKITVKNPATGEVVKVIKKNSSEEIINRITKGSHSFTKWKKVNAHERSKLLIKWAKSILIEKEEIAEIMTKENGKPISEARNEIEYAVSYIRWYAEEAKRIYGRIIPTHSDNKRLQVTKQPIGLVGAITPWNFPAAMMTRKAAPALAAGCTFIVKPAAETPLTTVRLIELAHKSGIPKDVLQCVHGDGKVIGEIFTNSKLIKKITFTGSTPVGKSLIKASASTVKSVTMELGGHAPIIVTEDADIDNAVEQTIISKFRNAGQTCVCANRLIVHESIAKEFSQRLVEKTKKLIVGNGLDEQTNIGPVINKNAFDKIVEQINDAVQKGAEVLTGAEYKFNNKKGVYFISPTILDNVNEKMNILHEETFGPVAPIITYNDIDDAIKMANNTPYGLAAYFFTNNYKVGYYLSENLEYGIIGWNDGAVSAAHVPFGGMKESGLGREGGLEGIESYLETKYLSIGQLQN